MSIIIAQQRGDRRASRARKYSHGGKLGEQRGLLRETAREAPYFSFFEERGG